MRGGPPPEGTGSPDLPTRSTGDTSARAEEIRAGAARAFSRLGYHATGMREISRETGASLGSIYHHYKGKEDILRAILEGNFRRVLDGLDQRMAGLTDPREQLTAFVENHVSWFARHLDEMRVMSHELDTLTGEAGERVTALRRDYTARAREILHALRPDLERVELQVATLSLFGMINWAYRWFHTLPPAMDTARLGRRMAALFLDGFLDRGETP